jgi:hypothetical protein
MYIPEQKEIPYLLWNKHPNVSVEPENGMDRTHIINIVAYDDDFVRNLEP